MKYWKATWQAEGSNWFQSKEGVICVEALSIKEAFKTARVKVFTHFAGDKKEAIKVNITTLEGITKEVFEATQTKLSAQK
jgi:hypothetical protein